MFVKLLLNVLLGEDYEILSCLPETVVYTCAICTVDRTPKWRTSISEHRATGLKVVLNTLLYSKCARHLIKQVRIWCL